MNSTPPSAPLLGWDLAAWRLAAADPSLRSTVVGIIEIAGSVDGESLLRRLNRAVASESVLRSRIVTSTGGPALQEMSDFDVMSVVNFFSTDVSVQTVAHDMARESFEAPLPLWRLACVTKNDSTFIIAALHHAISDGNGALILAGHLFDESLVIPPEEDPHQSVSEESQSATATPLQQALVRTLERAIRDPQGLARDVTSMLKSISGLIEVPRSSHATEMSERGPEFSYSLFRISKKQVRAAIAGQGVSQHDALVASVAKALYLYHSARGQSLEKIRINVPVALDAQAVAANNLVVARLEIDIDESSVAQLMQRSNAALRSWRQQPALQVAQELVEASRLIPTHILAAAIKKADATISTMRGLPRMGHVFGSPVVGIWPLVAPVGAAVSVTSMGTGLDIAMCVSVDEAAVSDVALWNSCLATSMSEAAGVVLEPMHF